MRQVLSASRSEPIEVFTGLAHRTFRRLVAQVEPPGNPVADGIKGQQWLLPLADRVLLVATYYRSGKFAHPDAGSPPKWAYGQADGRRRVQS